MAPQGPALLTTIPHWGLRPEGNSVWCWPGPLYLSGYGLLESCPNLPHQPVHPSPGCCKCESQKLLPVTFFGQLLLDEPSHLENLGRCHPHSHPKQPVTDGYRGIKPCPLASRWDNSVMRFTLQSPHSTGQGRNLPETTSLIGSFLCLSCFPHSLTSFFPGHSSINSIHPKLFFRLCFLENRPKTVLHG